MGLFSGLFSSKVVEKKSDKKEIVVLIGGLKYQLQIMREEHYQKTLEAICGPHGPGGVKRFETAWLILEDENRRDKNAVRVEIRGRQVGNLHPESAILYRQQLMARGTPNAHGRCQAAIKGGWLSSDGRKGPYEVWLDISSLSKQ
jgi:hypothetical protein